MFMCLKNSRTILESSLQDDKNKLFRMISMQTLRPKPISGIKNANVDDDIFDVNNNHDIKYPQYTFDHISLH